MVRNIIEIDQEKCIGCQLCVNACHEGAIGMVDGKAKLLRDDYCDGLGNCLPACPTGAINITQREAVPFDKEAVKIHKQEITKKTSDVSRPIFSGGCPGSRSTAIKREWVENESFIPSAEVSTKSQLSQWPVQIKLVPVNAPYFDGANLLVAADCSAFAYGNFHERFIKNRIALIGCPKLDEGDYSEKLTAIIKSNDIQSLTIVRMEVPCCAGIEHAAKKALMDSGKFIPWQIVTITVDGQIKE